MSVLVAVDLQRIFAVGPWGAPRFAEIIDPIGALLAAHGAGARGDGAHDAGAHDAGDEVVFTRFVAPADPVGAWRDYYRRWPFALQPADAEEYALVDAFAAHRGRTVDATTFGKWPALTATRTFASGTELVVCGVSTDCCVLSTVLAAADDGMRVRVVADACAGVDDANHAKALDVMALYGPLVEIVTVADVLAGSTPAP